MGFQKLCSETCLGPDIGHGNQTSVVSQGQGQKVEVMAGSGVRGGTYVVYSSMAHLRSRLCLSMALSCSFRKLPSGSLP